MAWYYRVRTIKGRQYSYLQRTYREGGKVRTETIYLGPVGVPARKKKPIGDRVMAATTRAVVRWLAYPDGEMPERGYSKFTHDAATFFERPLEFLSGRHHQAARGPSTQDKAAHQNEPSEQKEPSGESEGKGDEE